MVQTKETGRLRRYRFPVLLAAFAVVMLANAAVMQLVSPVVLLALPVGAGSVVAVVAGYRKLSRVVEQRTEIPEFAGNRMWPQLLRGAALGSGMSVLLLLLIGMFGGWQDLSGGSLWGCLGAAGLMASVAVTEEVLFRGVLFRIMEERTGTTIALVLSSLIFGLAHSINADATLWGVLSIALTGGLLSTSAYVATRSLWLSTGLHFAWNFTNAGIFGVAVSGSAEASPGLLRTTLSGPDVLTGGVFGPEASLLALLVCAVPTVVLLRRAARTGRIRRRAAA
ncbi:CPBP family intramembrane glutamic endopeptidase [Amycolatopsis sp. GA6-003]|uniref:CPBP family intramembrane glutamic endopeptidase n=1 Tax=Amycolatopsis sp. GA6-003 TaxID=2652444 RepID=UPI0039170BAF